MNRRAFVKGSLALAGVAAIGNIGLAEEGTGTMNKKPLVVYFSHAGENYSVGVITEGNTAKVAKALAAQTGADLWEIKEADPYSQAYAPCITRAKKEREEKARPAILGEIPDLAKYDEVYLGYPNWWGDAPMVVYTFMDRAKIEGKTFYPFCTHEGSGLGSTDRSLATAYPKATIAPQGLALYGHVAQKEPETVKTAVADWLKKIGKETVPTVYPFSVKGLKGETVSLGTYRGKVLLIVNTATRCGFTPQYTGLEAMYERLKERGFEILDFPCNQFGRQAPGTDEEIHAFCVGTYKTTFPQFAKIEVNGENADPLFKFLTGNMAFNGFPPDGKFAPVLDKIQREADPDYAKKSSIKWNFTKFLVGRDGRVLRRFEPNAPLSDVEAAITQALKE